MSRGTHERPGGPPSRRLGWRVATPVAVLMCGAIFAVSAGQSGGMDLRGGRLTDLESVVRAERDQTNALTERVNQLNGEVDLLSSGLGDRSVKRIQKRIETLVDPAGLTPKSGPAVSVTLTDAPVEVLRAYAGNPNDMVVHQQDIQAVANAMWRAGATAVTIQGQRLVSTTGIKCEGNTVTLEGVPYAPPYVIAGIGPTAEILAALDEDPAVLAYRQAAGEPGGGVGWEVEHLTHATAPAYEGLIDLTYATPIRD